MNDRPSPPDSGNDSGRLYDRDEATGIPRWVKVSGIVVLLLALLTVVVMLVGGGGHGPSRHSSGAGDPTPPAGAPILSRIQ